MLELLHIENIAVIEAADIAFRPGFNALTGETGAGKSIVVDALGAVLGGRTSRELIRTGAKSALVNAVFTGVSGLGWLEENGVPAGEELLLQREIQGDGRNICRVDGRLVTVAQLRELGRQLLNIHGQHDGQQLLEMVRTSSPTRGHGDGALRAWTGSKCWSSCGSFPRSTVPGFWCCPATSTGPSADLAAANGADHFMVKPCKFTHHLRPHPAAHHF